MDTALGFGYRVDGIELARNVFCSPIDMGMCEKLIAEQTEGMSREELEKYAAEILLGLLCLKQEVVNATLFGKKSAGL